MVPIFVFDSIGAEALPGASIRSIILVRLSRLLQLFFRTMAIFRESRFLYLMTFAAGAIITGATRATSCVPSCEIVPILNTLGPRITVEEDEGWAATPELTLVATVTVVPETEAAVRPPMLRITRFQTIQILLAKI
jgi:hypothetical protein